MMYNPSDVGKKGSLFGLPFTEEGADFVLLPVHLDTTVSYNDGAAKAPDLILEESTQLDLSLLKIEKPWLLKVALADRIVSRNKNAIHRETAKNVIRTLEAGIQADKGEIRYVNEFCEAVVDEVELTTEKYLNKDKQVGVVGGDHSAPLGLIRALSKRQSFGILQIDAHMDLREAYEGFIYSHASIMYNSLKLEGVKSLTQVGVRDFCEEEEEFIRKSEKRINVFYDEELNEKKSNGQSWKSLCYDIISSLPNTVYISFDVDGLNPSLCPNTGTPVPGGLSFNEAMLLIEQVVKSGKKIIGFDVCETGRSTWDANVAARILYRLAAYSAVSLGLLRFR